METWPLTSSREVYAGAMDSCWSLSVIVIDGLALGRIRFILLQVPVRLAGEHSRILCLIRPGNAPGQASRVYSRELPVEKGGRLVLMPIEVDLPRKEEMLESATQGCEIGEKREQKAERGATAVVGFLIADHCDRKALESHTAAR